MRISAFVVKVKLTRSITYMICFTLLYGVVLFLGQVQPFDILKFYLFVFCVLVIPQAYVLKIFRVNLDHTDKLVLTFGTGLVIQSVLFYGFSLCGIRPVYLGLLILVNVLYIVSFLEKRVKDHI